MKNKLVLFTRWYQELAGFNFTVLHKNGKENSRLSHMSEASPLSEEEYTEFYEIDKPVIQFAEVVNEIQHIQHPV